MDSLGLRGRRIVVAGTAGAGKTVFARRLALVLGCPHIELDALHWGPGWTPADRDAFRARVRLAVGAPAWVADGNYSSARDLLWPSAQSLVWLDYPLGFVLARLLSRTLRRSIGGEELWNGNRENLVHALCGRESLLLWALRTHGTYRRAYPQLLGLPEYSHLQLHRLRSARAAEQWLQALRTDPPA